MGVFLNVSQKSTSFGADQSISSVAVVLSKTSVAVVNGDCFVAMNKG
jgi:hypothetical protein